MKTKNLYLNWMLYGGDKSKIYEIKYFFIYKLNHVVEMRFIFLRVNLGTMPKLIITTVIIYFSLLYLYFQIVYGSFVDWTTNAKLHVYVSCYVQRYMLIHFA